MFAERITHPPSTGGAGIGLIMLRKDYGASIGARMTTTTGDSDLLVEVEVTVDNRDVDQRG